MKPVRSLIIALAIAGCARAGTAPQRAEPARLRLFLLAGQSNMAGRGAVDPQDRVENARVLMLNRRREWVPAVEPMHFDKPIAGVGPGRAFGLAIAETDSASAIGLIPAAVGGSPIASWEPGALDAATSTHPYDDAIKRARAAMASGTLEAILWHQGESDSREPMASAYGARLRALINRFRADLGAPSLPFVIGQLGRFQGAPWGATRASVDSVHRALASEMRNVVFVSSEGLTDKGDTTHFDAASARALGRRFAEAYLARRRSPPQAPTAHADALTAVAPRAPWRDETLPFPVRVDDLVGRMTLEEKVSQMKDVAPAIERLSIPAYQWWNEGLHGVARAGLATSFPQAIGIAATWNDSLVFRMATVISDEFRAKYHDYLRQDSHLRYQGLTVWSPNINLFRDPRWGRGQETYGEDPFLTGRIAVPFIKGLQGDDPKYYKTIATVKHFAVHSGPESDRHSFDAVISERDLRESYLPQFEMGIRDAGAYSLMCAYNRIGGQAACAHDQLERQILRGEWKFPGYIVSDCGAIDDLYLHHKVAPTAAAAAALAVRAGTDLDCGRVYPNLVDAVRQGLITEAQIDTSVKRLFLARMKLGMFDAPEHVRWAGTPLSVLDQPSHRELAREVARQSIVLLKNGAHTLPLRKTLGTIAVIGPNADQARVQLGNYNGEPSQIVTPLQGIRAAVSRSTRVLYARGADLADDFPVLDPVSPDVLSTPEGVRGLRVEYFDGQSMGGTPRMTATDSTISTSWHDGAPRAGMNPDDFSVRWSGSFRPPRTGSYLLGLAGTMKFQLYLDDSLIVRSVYPSRDGEFPDPRPVQSTPLLLDAGRSYRLRVEAQETYGDAQLQLIASMPHATLEDDAVAAARQADAVVMVLGLTARLEGEEMPVAIDGFRGGDRTRIDLPRAQERLLERIATLGKPTVLVLLNGSALAVNWAQAHVPAIVEGWYPGQAGGTALADVLFGDYSPAGRLPVTFYRDTTDLPPFSSYGMANRTYRFFAGTPLYPFGHGLSYTTFRYSALRSSAAILRANGSLVVTVDVTNTGTRVGDEVVQLYARHVGSSVDRPKRDLRGFQRITLAPGQRRTVSFPVNASSLAWWNPATHAWSVESDSVALEVGASSADIRLTKIVRVKP